MNIYWGLTLFVLSLPAFANVLPPSRLSGVFTCINCNRNLFGSVNMMGDPVSAMGTTLVGGGSFSYSTYASAQIGNFHGSAASSSTAMTSAEVAAAVVL